MNDLRLTRDEARRIDEAAVSQLGISSLVLMENAARGVCDRLLQDTRAGNRIVIICGPGNNGGDGLALARQLAAAERPCEVYLVRAGKTLAADALSNFTILQAAAIEAVEVTAAADLREVVAALTSSDMIVDCLLGTGVRGTVREPYASIIETINQSAARVLAVDVPSGLDCDAAEHGDAAEYRGELEGASVQADHTITFVARKRVFDHPQARQRIGGVSVAHIGLPMQWIRVWLTEQRAGQESLHNDDD